MRRLTKKIFVMCLAAVLVILPVASGFAADEDAKDADTVSAVEGDGPSAELMAADLVLARPVGIASTVVGFAVFVVSLPFSIPGGNTQAVFDKAVAKPAVFTFHRPLGEFE